MRPRYELAEVVNRFAADLVASIRLTPLQSRVLCRIYQCRTAALGGHEEACDGCGTRRYSYNSCRDRHCPKCQAAKQALWVDDLVRSTLPVKHYHVVFTLPHVLNAVCLHDQRMYYDLLFAAAWNTLRSFGYSRHGVETGAVAVLHTWGQNLSLHPHLHCIVPAAGYGLDGSWKNTGASHRYLYPVGQLSTTFKGKFLDSLKRTLRKRGKLQLFDDKIRQSYRTPWVVHCEPPMANAVHVVKYLGQYTHRVAITNHRILNISNKGVTFVAKDYRDGAANKTVTLGGVEFLRRFSMHVLPRRFVKIRRFGIYNPTFRRNNELKFVPEERPDIETLASKPRKDPETRLERMERLTGINPGRCPACKKGRMVVVRELPRIRSPSPFVKKQPLQRT